MKLADVMASPVIAIGPGENLEEAARIMKLAGCRFLPVLVKGCPVGSITVEDLAITVVANGLPADETRVGQLDMARPLCLDGEIEIEDAAFEMARAHTRHIVVIDRDSKAVGVIGLTEISSHVCDATLGRTMRRIMEAEVNRYPTGDFMYRVPGVTV